MKLKLAVTVLALSTTLGCTRIEPGYEGIRVNLYGDGRGVDEVAIVTGRVWYNPFTQDIYEFPTHFVGYVWRADGDYDESVSFVTNDKVSMNVDVEVRLAFKVGRTPHVFVAHRRSPDEIVRGYIRGRVRDAFVRCAGTVDSMSIMGGGGVIILQDCAKRWLMEVHGDDYDFDTVVVASAPRVPDHITAQINDTIAATQEAAKAQAQVAIKTAQALQAEAEARGQANSVLINAERV